MKTNIYITLFLLLILFGCKKEDAEKKCYVGGMYPILSSMMKSKINANFNVNDVSYEFNYAEAVYIGYYNYNQFQIRLSDSTRKNPDTKRLDIYTPNLLAKNFFKNGILHIDSLNIANSGTVENFYQINGNMVWDSVALYGTKFRGKGYFEIKDTIKSQWLKGWYYPPQKISFRF